jgi:DNA polymerase I-like protein with 3'-5' exonuclease and polymerase domains/5'-3' exonuclease
MKIAFDMSSVMWTCLSVGTDREGQKVHHNGRLIQVNSAAYGYEFAVNSMLAHMKLADCQPKDIIMVFEGTNSKAPRLEIDPKYKSGRGDRPQEAYMAFGELQQRLREVFGKVGALALTQDNCEGDDTLAYLAENSEEDLRIISNDNDLAVLNGTNKYGAEITVSINGVISSNKYGDWPTEHITIYKSMVGDTSDSIVGIKGFGTVAWDNFVKEFGVAGMAEMRRLAELGTLDELVPEMSNKIVNQIVLGQADFLRSYKLAKLHPEWVNTLEEPLKFEPGMVKGATGDDRFDRYEGKQYLITAAKWDDFLEWCAVHLEQTPYVALDIETSTPDESDEWLAAQDDPNGVDVIGSVLTGMSLTFGANLQHTVYIPVDHKDTDNVSKAKLRDFIAALVAKGLELIIHNYSFEGTVLFNEWGVDWKDNGHAGLLPNALDTKLEASYVDENNSLGLKKLAKRWFNYDQVEYTEVTSITKPYDQWQGEGKLISATSVEKTPEILSEDGTLLVPATYEMLEKRQFKMRELTGAHVKDYGCDDTIVTGSFHNFAKLFMQLEHTYEVYRQVELGAMYLHTQSFIHGTKCDVAKSKELEELDDATYTEASAKLDAYLITKGWTGTVCPVYDAAITPAQVKEAFELYFGKELECRARLIGKLAEACAEQGGELFATSLLDLANAKSLDFNTLIAQKFTGKPVFNPGSPKQMQTLLYETMGLPVRVYNKPTPIAKKRGETQGSPKSDELAIAYAKMMDATPEQKEVLEALRLMKMVQTRKGLYYETYPYFVHWKTKRIHSSHNQCATNTRRASSSKPNLQQQPKHAKIEGQPARFREVMVPHKRNAVIVSLDFAAQELRVIADYSRDKNMLACFVGDFLKDMHALTGLGIAIKKEPAIEWSYELFADILGDKESHLHKFVKECRTLGKKVNFTTEYGAMAPKLAMTMLISESDAQAYIDAKEDAFPEAREWKTSVVDEARSRGYVTTKLGARRHLAPAFTSGDKWEASKAERQAVNFKIQSSSAEMTKLAEGRMWDARLEQRFDCEIIGPVHDEVVASCVLDDLLEFLPAMHTCMVAGYGDMTVPIRSSISFGPNFGVQIEIGEEPTVAAIEQGIREYLKLMEPVT